MACRSTAGGGRRRGRRRRVQPNLSLSPGLWLAIPVLVYRFQTARASPGWRQRSSRLLRSQPSCWRATRPERRLSLIIDGKRAAHLMELTSVEKQWHRLAAGIDELHETDDNV